MGLGLKAEEIWNWRSWEDETNWTSNGLRKCR